MGNLILEHKKLSFFIFLLGILYFFIVVPVENLSENKKELESKRIRLERTAVQRKITTERMTSLISEKEKLENDYKIRFEKREGFYSIGEFQKKLNRLLSENNIEILEIGRENISEDGIHEIPYVVSGKEEDIINFLSETDKDENTDFLRGAVELQKENTNLKLRFTAGVKVYTGKENYEEKTERSNLFFNKNEEYKLISFTFIGDNRGIFYIQSKKREKDIKRYYFKNNEKEFFNGREYKIELSKEKLILQDLEKENKIIFNLEAEVENTENIQKTD